MLTILTTMRHFVKDEGIEAAIRLTDTWQATLEGLVDITEGPAEYSAAWLLLNRVNQVRRELAPQTLPPRPGLLDPFDDRWV